jgi:His-Xaa-Ser system protein HxsD
VTTASPIESGPIILDVQTAVYPLPAIHRALYWLASTASSHVEMIASDRVRITLRPLQAMDSEELRRTVLQALNDFALRVDIEERTRNIREKIVNAALAEIQPVVRNDT